MGSRSRSKAEAAIKELKESTGKEAIFLELDLGSLTSVRNAANEFLRSVVLIFVWKEEFSQRSPFCFPSKERELHQLYLNA